MKTALITGAAGGIGQALCHAFAAAGYRVVTTDAAAATGVDIVADLAEVVRDESCRAGVLQQLRVSLADGLDVLVNNAACQVVAAFADTGLDDFRRVIDVNVTAPFLLARELLPLLQRRAGCVINIASIHGTLTKPGFSAYATSKAALLGLTRAMAVELGAGIRVNAISPAAIATPMLLAGFQGNDQAYAALESHHPAGRIGAPDEVADLAVFLASGQARFINGANLAIDGAIGARLHDPS